MSTAPGDRVRAGLSARLAELLDRAARIEAHERETDREVPSDWPDRAQYREDDEVVAKLDGMTRDEVAEIREALGRLDAGTYGTCTRCGGRIAPERLEALPSSPWCAACAQQAETR